MPGVTAPLDGNLLKGVSRSFYLSLRLLPAAMRPAASLGYLLARTSDTIADTCHVSVSCRRENLAEFAISLQSATATAPAWSHALTAALQDPRERHLLASNAPILTALRRLPAAEARLVREVCEIIIHGQLLDLERFATAHRDEPVALADAAALADYTWRVAGCVGEFWTKLGFLTFGKRYSHTPEAVLLEQGRHYGMGLQLVNILRDLGPDLAVGRCYLPVLPSDPERFLAAYLQWFQQAKEWTSVGKSYAAALGGGRRLRVATVLPALLAEKTLLKLAPPIFPLLQTGVKISRKQVYMTLARAVFHSRLQ